MPQDVSIGVAVLPGAMNVEAMKTWQHEANQKFSTLTELLLWHAQQTPEHVVFRYLSDGETETEHDTYRSLVEKASAFAVQLKEEGLAPGSRVMLIEHEPAKFVAAFFGTMLANMVPVPAYPPDPNRLEKTLPRLLAIVRQCQPSALVVPEVAKDFVLQLVESEQPTQGLKVFSVKDTYAWVPTPEFDPQGACVDAFLQYTSGSTGNPKGVRISHRNLLANVEMIHQMLAGNEAINALRMCTWLPLFHDMGLVGAVCFPVYLKATCILMPPMAFLQKPIRWLQAITKYQANGCVSPDFGYQLLLRKVPEDKMSELNLSSLVWALTGAEPVRVETLRKFHEKFKKVGFDYQVIKPVYGLAEATLIVSGRGDGGPRFLNVSKTDLQNHVVRIVEEGSEENIQTCVECGTALGDEEIAVVSADSDRVVPDLAVGEICIAGSNVTMGYYGDVQDSRDTVLLERAGDSTPKTFLRTGDLGFLLEGRLFVTGRKKDLIIIAGSNYYPQDLEKTVEAASAYIRPGCVIAFSDDSSGTERLVLVLEAERRFLEPTPEMRALRKNQVDPFQPDGLPGPLNPEGLVAAIRENVFRFHGLDPYAIVLVRPGSLPKTSSGKVQRQFGKQQFLKNQLEVIHRSQRNFQSL